MQTLFLLLFLTAQDDAWSNWIAAEASKWTLFDVAVVLGLIALAAWQLKGMKKTEKRRDRLVREVEDERAEWDRDVDAEIEREQRGEVKGPKDPELAAWWDDVKRQRRGRR